MEITHIASLLSNRRVHAFGSENDHYHQQQKMIGNALLQLHQTVDTRLHPLYLR